MSRSFRCFVFAFGVLVAYGLFGNVKSWAQAGSETTPIPKVETPKQKYPEVEKAIEDFKKRDFDAAELQLEKAATKYPELPPAQIVMAQLFAANNQAFLMRMALEKAVLKSPTDPESFAIMGNIALQDRRITEADMLLSKARELLQKFDKADRKKILEPQIMLGLATVAEAREDWKTAQSYLDTLLKVVPDDKDNASVRSAALQRVARALFNKKPAEVTAAYDKLKEAYAADPKNALNPEAALSLFYHGYGDPKNAKIWMTTALSRDPNGFRTLLTAGQLALEMGEIDEAQKHAAKAMQVDPKSLDAKLFRGVVSLFLKDYKKAEDYFREAHDTSPGHFGATNNLALALCEQNDDGKKLKALEYADINYRSNPKSAEAASTLGWCWYKKGDLDRAEQAFRIALQSGGLKPDTAYYMAQISYDRGRKDEAKALLDAALKNKGPFSMRPEAKALADKIKKEPATSKKDSN